MFQSVQLINDLFAQDFDDVSIYITLYGSHRFSPSKKRNILKNLWDVKNYSELISIFWAGCVGITTWKRIAISMKIAVSLMNHFIFSKILCQCGNWYLRNCEQIRSESWTWNEFKLIEIPSAFSHRSQNNPLLLSLN